MKHWSTAEVATFIDSLAFNGSRDTCAPGCGIPPLFESARYVARNIDGQALRAMLVSHAEHETMLHPPTGWIANTTSLRAAHTKELLHDLLPPGNERREPAYMIRLHSAAKALHFDGPPAPASPPAAARAERRALMRSGAV